MPIHHDDIYLVTEALSSIPFVHLCIHYHFQCHHILVIKILHWKFDSNVSWIFEWAFSHVVSIWVLLQQWHLHNSSLMTKCCLIWENWNMLSTMTFVNMQNGWFAWTSYINKYDVTSIIYRPNGFKIVARMVEIVKDLAKEFASLVSDFKL